MNTESSQEIARLRLLEQRFTQFLAQVHALEVRQAASEQGAAQLGAALGFVAVGGGGNIVPAVSSGSISAFSGGTPGSGSATLITGPTVTVSNYFSTSIASGKNLIVAQDATGAWWVLSGDC